MSSFWETSSHKQKQVSYKNNNQSLPSLSQTTKFFRSKGSSKTIHQILASDQSKVNINRQESSIKRKIAKQKQTFVSVHSRSTYRLPTTKNRTQYIPIIQFTHTLSKIQDIFNQEFNISQLQFKLKIKKTCNGKMTFGKLSQLQNLLQTNPKKQAKKQFQQIFRLFNRIPIKPTQTYKKLQKDDIPMRTRKNNTFTINNLNQKESNEEKGYDQNLNQVQKQEFMRQTKAFQKSQKHLMLKSYTVKLFYHHLNSQLALESGILQDALLSLYYCQYYARKIDFDFYVIPCLIMQSQIKQSLYDFDESIKILKTALQFSVIKRWKQLEMRILQKVSIIYYYRGNSYMAKYYKDIAEVGLSQNQADIYIKEYSKNEQLKSLQARLFSLPYDGMNKKKHNQKYELDISRDLFQDHQKMIFSHHQQVSSMLRSNKTSKIGIKLRKLIIQNCQKAQVKKFNHKKHTSEVMPRFVSFQYPMQHCSQILKSHLSKTRFAVSSQIKNVNFVKTLNFMRTLYRRLIYELSNQKGLQTICEKQNLPYINQS